MLLFNYALWYFLQEKSDEMYEDGIMELFPDGYSTGAFSTADSGKLLVLTDLLLAIQHVNRTDRYHIYTTAAILHYRHHLILKVSRND